MARKKSSKNIAILIIAILLAFAKFSTNYNVVDVSTNNYENEISQSAVEIANETVQTKSKVYSDLKVYFLDVGQADCILIQNGNKNMLIDAGNNADGEKIVTYFKSLGISKFDYIVGTHPHEDHIGGMDDIVQNFDIGAVYMPDASTTTATFEDLLDSLIAKNLSVISPQIGDKFEMAECQFSVMSVGENEKDLNENSIVLKMQFGNNSFLFTGDATSENEEKMLALDISADVLKVGHHGSEYSTSLGFLDKVNPKYAVISVGKNNNYGHPTNETLQKLQNKNVEVFRTDEDGTILIESDGENIEIQKISTNTNGGK